MKKFFVFFQTFGGCFFFYNRFCIQTPVLPFPKPLFWKRLFGYKKHVFEILSLLKNRSHSVQFFSPQGVSFLLERRVSFKIFLKQKYKNLIE